MNEEKKITLDEYLSQARHDIRVHLTVINEGISMVLDGLGNNDCQKCFHLLKLAMEHVEQTNKLLKNILSASEVKTKVCDLNKEG